MMHPEGEKAIPLKGDRKGSHPAPSVWCVPWVARVGSQGRPQGSPPRSTPPPPLQWCREGYHRAAYHCKGGGGVERGGDPCGRPRGM